MADALKNLDVSIKNWVQSDGVFQTILDLNKELGCFGEELSVISQLIISVSLKEVKPENVAQEIAKGLPFLEDKQVEHAATVLKKKVFYPMGPAFKKQGIDIDKISTTLPVPVVAKPVAPVAREVRLEPKPVSRPPVGQSPVGPQKPAGLQSAPKVREMQFAPMTDVRRPVGPSPVGPSSAGQPKSPAPSISAPANPFGLSDVVPKAPTQPSVSQSPVSQPKPEPHELTEYKDDHPMKES